MRLDGVWTGIMPQDVAMRGSDYNSLDHDPIDHARFGAPAGATGHGGGAPSEPAACTLVFDPVHDLATGRVSSLEARRRAAPSTTDADTAAAALGPARDGALGHRTLGEACRHLRGWRDAGCEELRLSIDVSARDIARPTVVATVLAALSRHDLPTDALELEIDERTARTGGAAARTNLGRFQRLGVRLAIDGFGRDAAPLAILRDLEVDTVKLDPTIVRGLGSPLRAPHFALALIDAMTLVARHLDVVIVACGVDTVTAHDTVRNLDCRAAQGPFYGPTLTTTTVVEYVQERLPPA